MGYPNTVMLKREWQARTQMRTCLGHDVGTMLTAVSLRLTDRCRCEAAESCLEPHCLKQETVMAERGRLA